MNEFLQKTLSKLEDMISTQKDCMVGCGDAVDYMHGMANGMILAHSMFTDQSPKYIQRPRRPYGRIVRHKLAKSKRHR
jgi:hypothetical protein